MSTLPPCVLTIAGSDSGGGAGIQADARTIHAMGGFACTAITAITAQNPRGVRTWEPATERMIAAQIEAVLGAPSVGAGLRRGATDRLLRRPATREGRRAGALAGSLPIRAIKTGLIPGASAVRAIARMLASHASLPLVVDPVIASTSGTRFLDDAGVKALRRDLLPLATVVTPNWPEAETLTGLKIGSYTAAERAARQLASESGCAVLLKGGHARGDVCRDCLATADGSVHWFESRRIDTPNTHGTGCVLSAAIATYLAKGRGLEIAVAHARDFLRTSLRQHRSADWAGAGPAFPG